MSNPDCIPEDPEIHFKMVIHPSPPADITLHQIILINKRSRGAFTLAKRVALAFYRSAGRLYLVISAIVANAFKAAAA